MELSASTAYGDALLDNKSMRWFTGTQRTLASPEVRPIVDNQVDAHVFPKKDDAEGSDFLYRSGTKPEADEQTSMPGNCGDLLSVEKVVVRFELTMAVASGRMRDVAEIADALHVVKTER